MRPSSCETIRWTPPGRSSLPSWRRGRRPGRRRFPIMRRGAGARTRPMRSWRGTDAGGWAPRQDGADFARRETKTQQADHSRRGMAHPEIRLARILVPTDFSADAELAYPWAHSMSHAFKAEVIFLHVIDQDVTALTPMSMPPMPSAEEEIMERVRLEAMDLLSRLSTEFPQARTLIRDGAPRAMIVDVASETDAHLIVMGTHGRTGLAHAAFGSVAEYVIQHSKVPVLAIRRVHIKPPR